MVLTARQRIRFLRLAVADLAMECQVPDPIALISDTRAAREARIAIDMANAGQLKEDSE